MPRCLSFISTQLVVVRAQIDNQEILLHTNNFSTDEITEKFSKQKNQFGPGDREDVTIIFPTCFELLSDVHTYLAAGNYKVLTLCLNNGLIIALLCSYKRYFSLIFHCQGSKQFSRRDAS